MEELISVKEASQLLGINPGTLYKLASQRVVPSYRLSKRLRRFRKSELIAWAERNRIDELGAKRHAGAGRTSRAQACPTPDLVGVR